MDRWRDEGEERKEERIVGRRQVHANLEVMLSNSRYLLDYLME